MTIFNSLMSPCKFGINYNTFRCFFPCKKCHFVRGIAVKSLSHLRRTPLQKHSILKPVALEETAHVVKRCLQHIRNNWSLLVNSANVIHEEMVSLSESRICFLSAALYFS